MYLAKPAPPFEPGMLVVTKNDLTYLGRSEHTGLGSSAHISHENYQYPAGTVLMIVDVERGQRIVRVNNLERRCNV